MPGVAKKERKKLVVRLRLRLHGMFFDGIFVHVTLLRKYSYNRKSVLAKRKRCGTILACAMQFNTSVF